MGKQESSTSDNKSSSDNKSTETPKSSGNICRMGDSYGPNQKAPSYSASPQSPQSPYSSGPLPAPQTKLPGGIEALDTLWGTAEGFGGLNALGKAVPKAAPLLQSAGNIMNFPGGAMDALSLYNGTTAFTNAALNGNPLGTEGSQGALDIASGGLGLASLLIPGVAPYAAGAGVVSYGNPTAEANGYYGTHQGPNGAEPATFGNSITDRMSQSWDSAHEVFGNNIVGDGFGAFNAGWNGTGQAMYNTGAAGVGAVQQFGSDVAGLWDMVF